MARTGNIMRCDPVEFCHFERSERSERSREISNTATGKNEISPLASLGRDDRKGPLGRDDNDAVLVIGVFDGMHIGHRAIFAQARELAREIDAPLVAVTFDRDPDEVFRRDDPSFGKLLSNEERLAMAAEQTSGGVLALTTGPELFSMPPLDFLDFLASVVRPRAIFTGSDFRFGYKASGTAEDLERWALAHDCTYVACELVEEDGEVISATRIRAELREGEVAQAKRLLAGRLHAITGTIVHGRGAGDGFGFATANLDLSGCETMLPREGVYGAYAIVEGVRYAAAVNVGVARSFAEATAPVEAHLLDFDGDLYGREIRIEFEQWLRGPRVFETKDELIETVMGNIAWVREHLGGK